MNPKNHEFLKREYTSKQTLVMFQFFPDYDHIVPNNALASDTVRTMAEILYITIQINPPGNPEDWKKDVTSLYKV